MTARLRVATVAALEAIAAGRGASRNAVLRDALEEYARKHSMEDEEA